MRSAIAFLAAVLAFQPLVVAQDKPTCDERFDTLYAALLEANRKFPADPVHRQELEQFAQNEFSRDLPTCACVAGTYDAVFERLLSHLVIARRYDTPERAVTRQILGQAGQQIHAYLLPYATDREPALTPRECFDDFLGRLRRARTILGNLHDLRRIAEQSAYEMFSTRLGTAVDGGGVDYPSVYAQNVRTIDRQFEIPGPAADPNDRRLALLRERNETANALARQANLAMLNRVLQK